MALGDKIATLPLPSLQIELEIEEAFADGRMLALIERALEFVNDLRLGEALPAEELSGGARWQPDQVDLKLAVSRIKLLAAWPGDGKKDEWRDVNDEMILAMVDSPDTRQRVQEALAAVAQALGLANTEAGVDLVEDAARELAFVEALGARLLHRVEAASVRLEHLARGIRGDATPHEVMTRVRRLMGIAVVRFRTWFEELDAQTGEVLALLRNFNSQRDLSAPTETGFTAVCARGSRCSRTGIMREQAWTRSSGCWSAAPTSSQHPDICRCRSGNPWRKPPSSMRQNRGNWYGEPQPHRRARGFCSTWNRLPAVAPKNA